MKNLIYQFWDGNETPGNVAGVKEMRRYASTIGAEYVYEHNPRFRTDLGAYSPHYGAFKPVFDSKYHEYDYILFADTDVIPVTGLTENIFEQFYNTDYEIGICEEWNAPETRAKHNIGGITSENDNKWAKIIEGKWQSSLPRTSNNLLRVFNSGVVVYSQQGAAKARERFVDFKQYVSLINNNKLPPFYTCDQPYIHAMIQVCEFNWKLMDYKWNSSVHYTPGTSGDNRPVTDLRDNANFVHIQLRGADNWNEDKIIRVTNLPVGDWKLNG